MFLIYLCSYNRGISVVYTTIQRFICILLFSWVCSHPKIAWRRFLPRSKAACCAMYLCYKYLYCNFNSPQLANKRISEKVPNDYNVFLQENHSTVVMALTQQINATLDEPIWSCEMYYLVKASRFVYHVLYGW